jgi:undecaprenyl-phosphate galactose phosphotransferase
MAILIANIVYGQYSPHHQWDYVTNDLIWGYILILVTVFLAFEEMDLYKYQVILNKVRHSITLQKALFLSLVALVFCSFIFKFHEVSAARILLGLIYINLSLITLLTRVIILPNIFFKLVREKVINRNLLIVGTGNLSTEHAEELIENRNSYFNIVGLIDDEESVLGTNVKGIPVLGKISDLPQLVELYNVKDILVASDTRCDNRLHEIIDQCKEANKTVHIVSELYNIAKQKIQIEEIGKVSAFRYVPPQPGSKFIYPFIKRVIDIVVAFTVIVGLFPLWLTIALLIKMTSSGPVFYKPKVIGKNSQLFSMYKFRSMQVNVSTKLHQDKVIKMIRDNEATTKIVKDPRITALGRILRKLSIDEFPQLINVLRGEMSLVGPRPCLPYEFEAMKEWQKQRCAITPGMTGLWQIKGRDEVLFNQQVILDLYYKEHRSIWMDLQILFGTIPVVIFGRGGA